METYPDPDDIRKNTADILKALTVDNIPERHGFREELASLKNCINDDEYCYMTFYETGYAFLKALLRTRLRLKRTDPAHSLLPLISSSVEALRTQLGVSLEIGNFCTLSALFNQSRCVTD